MKQGTETQAAVKAAVMPGKYTLLGVSEWMATTTKTEVEIVEIQNRESWAQYKDLTVLVIKQRGKRKLVGKYVKDSDLILKGWGLGLVIDSEDRSADGCTRFSGNALVNLRGDAEAIRNTINAAFAYGGKGLCVGRLQDGTEFSLFPAEAAHAQSGHAVLARIMAA